MSSVSIAFRPTGAMGRTPSLLPSAGALANVGGARTN